MSTAAISTAPQRPHRVRMVTAASLFDGHDAAINIMRRILQAQGAEVIHLGHDRSVDEIVTAAIQEDAHGVAISSYQGGHLEFFRYLVDRLREQGADHIRVFGGGGGTGLRRVFADYGDAASLGQPAVPAAFPAHGSPGVGGGCDDRRLVCPVLRRLVSPLQETETYLA